MKTVILLDASASMNMPTAGGHRRIDVLAVILKQLLTPDVHLVAFNDEVAD